jgi:hypothetical protein
MHTIPEEIEVSLGELEAIKRRLIAALRLADHPECDLTIYLFELAAIQLVSLLEQHGVAPRRQHATSTYWWQPSPASNRTKH